jgi:methionine synthase II (cobalamin-independent)
LNGRMLEAFGGAEAAETAADDYDSMGIRHVPTLCPEIARATQATILSHEAGSGQEPGVARCRRGHCCAILALIAERLFGELKYDRFLLEYDSPRAGSFEPLRFVPKGKIVVLGLISTKVPALESVDGLKRRIDEAAKYLPLEQLALSPQCGFASDFIGNLVGEEDRKRKLEVVVETARQVWGSS